MGQTNKQLDSSSALSYVLPDFNVSLLHIGIQSALQISFALVDRLQHTSVQYKDTQTYVEVAPILVEYHRMVQNVAMSRG